VLAAAVAVIVLVRHGQTDANARRELVGRSDPPLNERGRAQARALSTWLDQVVAVWVSPLSRARETAALALGHLEAEVHEEFIELDYGTFEGKSASALKNGVSARRDHDDAFEGGESLADVDQRVRGALEKLLDDQSSLLHDEEHHLAIVSHVSPIKAALRWALDAPPSLAWRTRLDNGSMTSILAREGVATLVSFNVVPRL